MEHCIRRFHGHLAVAVIGSVVALAGIGLTVLQPAFADDDDWHTEAERPITSQSTADTDHGDARPQVAAKLTQQTLYVPPALIRSTQSVPLILTSYQTADAARRRQ